MGWGTENARGGGCGQVMVGGLIRLGGTWRMSPRDGGSSHTQAL